MTLTLFTLLLCALFVVLLLGRQIARIFSMEKSAGAKLNPIKDDPQNVRSHITFKPLPRFYDHAAPARHPFSHPMTQEIFERLQQRGAVIERVQPIGDAQRVRMRYDGECWELTLGPYKTHPEQWLMKVDMLVKRKQLSAPHDIAPARSLLVLIKNVLNGMDVSTVRWHQRQYWNAGKVDVWSHKPF